MRVRAVMIVAAVSAVVGGLLAGPLPASAEEDPLPTSPELSETTRLDERRAVTVGDRSYSVGTEDGLYPGAGWHIRAEMGGFWTPPIKLLDGMWFGVDDAWLGQDVKAERFSSGWGYTRTDYATDGLKVARTTTAPDGIRAGLVGLTFTSEDDRTVDLTMDAHSELMSGYPWGWTTPNAQTFNLTDTGAYADGSLVFREQGTPPADNASAHDWAAVVGSSLTPTGHDLGPDFRGPQDPAVVCPGDGEAPPRCEDSTFGKGTGGRLTYEVPLNADEPQTVWFSVAGSDKGLAEATSQQAEALDDPAGLLATKVADRQAVNAHSDVDLPGDPLLEQSVAWSKQNLADSVQESHDLALRHVQEGRAYPATAGELDEARWFGAGWPDYPWLFGTDGEYTAFASVAAGQFATTKAHLRALRDVSEVVNERSGKVVHEVTPDGSVYFGGNSDSGNTDETSKFPSAVALVWRWTGDDALRDDLYGFTVRNMRFVYRTLDQDDDGWPEGLGNVERAGMGAEKLDNTVYTIRGLRDLADMARSKGDRATEGWASSRAKALESRFEKAWWFGGDTDQYADSLANPDNGKVFQRHWIGLTPMDAVLVRPGQPDRPLANDAHGQAGIAKREEACYSGTYGLFHTGTGPTSAGGGNKGPSCDSAVSTVQSERAAFGLNTAIMAAAEGNFGRLGADQQQRYTTANATIQVDPSVWEMPGAMPEIAPSPDFKPNIDRPLYDRSMVLQAWGAYGVLWPVVHHQLGVSPDLGRDRVRVVPQVPGGQQHVSGTDIALGDGAVDVAATREGTTLTTEVTGHDLDAALTIGHVLPTGATVQQVTLDDQPADYDVVRTARGSEVVVAAGEVTGEAVLEAVISQP
ncbi:MAG: glycogen debranching protein [Actinomycetes bacterium]